MAGISVSCSEAEAGGGIVELDHSCLFDKLGSEARGISRDDARSLIG